MTKCELIAEIGWNHMGDMNLAEKMISEATKSGADYCKFQTWKVKNLKDGPWNSDGRLEIYNKAELIVLDEPTNNLSLNETQKVFDFVLNVKKSNRSVLFIGHNIYHVYDISDRFVILDRGEVVHHLDKENIQSPEELMKIIPGPDFPTGGKIVGTKGIKDSQKSGRGSIIVQAKSTFEEFKSDREAIIFTELPYQVNKSTLIEKIAELVRDKKIEGITEIRDESDKDGLRVVIEVRKGDSVEVLENNLFAQTQLEQSFGINFTVLVDGQPKEVNLKEMLEAFVKHRKDIIIKRTQSSRTSLTSI